MKNLLLITCLSVSLNVLGQDSFLSRLEQLSKSDKLDLKSVNQYFQIDTTYKDYSRFYIPSTFIDRSGGASTVVLKEENGIGMEAYLISFRNDGQIIDTKRIMYAYDGPDLDFQYQLKGKEVTIQYYEQVVLASGEPEVREYRRYVTIDESGYFFMRSFPTIDYSKRLFPDASSRRLSKRDLKGKHRDELSMMRNEVFAAYGYIFKSDRFQSHFKKMRWYKPTQKDVTDQLTLIEKANVQLIKAVEDEFEDQ